VQVAVDFLIQTNIETQGQREIGRFEEYVAPPVAHPVAPLDTATVIAPTSTVAAATNPTSSSAAAHGGSDDDALNPFLHDLAAVAIGSAGIGGDAVTVDPTQCLTDAEMAAEIQFSLEDGDDGVAHPSSVVVSRTHSAEFDMAIKESLLEQKKRDKQREDSGHGVSGAVHIATTRRAVEQLKLPGGCVSTLRQHSASALSLPSERSFQFPSLRFLPVPYLQFRAPFAWVPFPSLGFLSLHLGSFPFAWVSFLFIGVSFFPTLGFLFFLSLGLLSVPSRSPSFPLSVHQSVWLWYVLVALLTLSGAMSASIASLA
jgi:hypothetical protein